MLLSRLLADTLGLGIKTPVFTLNSWCPAGVQRAVWASYVRYRAEASPIHTRTCASYRVRLFRMGSYVVKEYTGETRKVATELAVLQQLQHDSLVSFLFIADEGARLSVVMDWAGDGLREVVAGQGRCTEELAQHITFQLAGSLAYLHKHGILHRDVKADNIAVQPDLTVKLFDWSEALLLQQLQTLSDKQLARHAAIAGTPLFMPPEVLLHITAPKGSGSSSGSSGLRQLTSPALDVWGLGTVLYFLLAGRDIFQDGCGYTLEDMAALLSTSHGLQLPPRVQVSPSARDFLSCCLQRDPHLRASAQELLDHPWLAGPAAAAAAANADACGGASSSTGTGAGYAASALHKLGNALPSFSPPMSPHSSGAGYTIRTALYSDRMQSDSSTSAPDTPSSTSTGLTVG